MSDHESGSSPTGQEAESPPTASFSSNGSDPIGPDIETGGDPGESVVDSDAFLADLAKAMQATAAAEQARNAEGTEQRRQSHIDAIRAREAIEAEELRELAKEDVKGIDDWSDGEIKRIKLERERRIAARREQLQIRLEEHRTVIAQEVEAVEAAVASYRIGIEQYFRRLGSETDPVAIAKQAGTRPPFPALETIGPGDIPAASGSPNAAGIDTWSTGAGPADHDAGAGSGSQEPVAMSADAERTAQLSQAPWASGTAKGTTEGPADDAPAGEGTVADETLASAASSTESSPGEVSATTDTPPGDTPSTDTPVSEASTTTETPAADGPSTDTPVSEASAPTETPVGDEPATTESPDTTDETVAAAAEATVVMPRSTGAGSWLRWPNKSDSGR
jgi:hypothetical protein